MKARSSLLLSLLIICGCSDEKKFHPVYDVPAEFEPQVAAFISEASLRGLDYKIDNLIIHYDEAVASPICGQCNETTKNNDIQKIISINPKLTCWTTPEELETLIFHELGHCFLGRQHISDLLPNGDPKSIMTPNNNVLYPSCSYVIGTEPCDLRFKRKYYVDELFDETTPAPDWAK